VLDMQGVMNAAMRFQSSHHIQASTSPASTSLAVQKART